MLITESRLNEVFRENKNCDSCKNFHKKEEKKVYNDRFQIRYNKKEVISVNFIFIDNWFEDDEKYYISYTTERNIKTNSSFPKEKYDKFLITQSR